MSKKPATTDRGFRSPPWRVSHDVVERVVKLSETLPMTASEVARQALALGLDEIDKIVAGAGSGIAAAARVGMVSTRQRRSKART
ncbi:hypothetical protein K2Z84_32060 [Candidatus Binatia bacterium]|nr:hypothetical protein [Candidatus Binatia bacterium]